MNFGEYITTEYIGPTHMESKPSFTAVETGAESDEPLIPTDSDAHTTVEHRRLIATSLGFEDRRYSGSFPKPVMVRLYTVIMESLPESDMRLDQMKARIAAELGFDNPDRFLSKNGSSFRRAELLALTEQLAMYTQGEFAELLDSLDICPVCDKPVESTKTIGAAGQTTPTESTVCLYTTESGEIAIVDHWS